VQCFQQNAERSTIAGTEAGRFEGRAHDKDNMSPNCNKCNK
jgi:hypothetical protein